MKLQILKIIVKYCTVFMKVGMISREKLARIDNQIKFKILIKKIDKLLIITQM